MATDKTQPPIGRIIGVGALSIGILVGLQFVLNSYFITMYEFEEHRSVLGRPSELLQRKRSEDDEHLRSGRPMPIEQAVAAVARGERPSAIEPRPSSEYEAMRGWSLMPRRFDPTPIAGPGQAAPAPAFDPSAPVQAPAPGVGPQAPTAEPPMAQPTTAQPPADAPANAPAGPLPAVLAPAGPVAPGAGPTVHLPAGPTTPVVHAAVAPAARTVPAARPVAPRPAAAPAAEGDTTNSRPAAPPTRPAPVGAP